MCKFNQIKLVNIRETHDIKAIVEANLLKVFGKKTVFSYVIMSLMIVLPKHLGECLSEFLHLTVYILV